MRKTRPNPKTKWLHVRLSEAEHQQLHQEFSKTTERKLSAYARKILLSKPMICGYRDLTTEAMMAEFSRLNKTLNGLANNFNQAVHVLHTLQRSPEFLHWLHAHQTQQQELLQQVKGIREYMSKKALKWLQE